MGLNSNEIQLEKERRRRAAEERSRALDGLT